MIIGIDIDDTISKTFEYSYPLSKEFTKNKFNRDSLNIEDLVVRNHWYLSAINNWNTEESNMFWDENYLKIVQNVEPKTDAKEIIKQLKNDGHKIVLVTARISYDSFDVYEETKKWLEVEDICYDSLIIDANEKDVIAKNEKIDLFIDDSFENCLAISKIGIKTFLMDSEINKGLVDENVPRVFSWNEIYEKIKEEF